MTNAMPLTEKISQSSSRSIKYRVLKAQFGNGYAQVAPDGINCKVENWNIRYENIEKVDRDTVVDFLDTVAGWDLITWTPTNDTLEKTYRVTAEGYSEQSMAGTIFTISFNLEQVFL